MKLNRILAIALLFITPLQKIYAQSGVKQTGNVAAVTVSGQQVDITTDNAFIKLTVYSPTIVRVRMDKQKLGDDFSYAVIGTPVKTRVTVNQTADEININTDSLKVNIKKQPFLVTFLTPGGEVINQDEPGLTTSWVNESVTTYKHMQENEHFIGLGEKTGPLDRKGNAYTHWNSDTYAYTTNQDPIYSTIPFYIGVHHQVNYGIFFDNTWQSDFNFGASNNRFSSFGAKGGEMNYYFIYHTHIADIIRSYTSLTGLMKMPPLWSLGYQQNRYSYYPETEVMRIAETLREKKIPADGITLDIHYMDKYKVFTWDESRFPNPTSMTKKLGDMGFKVTLIVDPGVKVEKGYGTYERGVKDDIFAKYPDGSYYTGQVWPGWCHFPDFTNPKGRAFWANELKKYASEGISGIWNDMNEFSTWGQKAPDNILFNYEGKGAAHPQVHNVYGLEMIRSSYEGYKAARENKRPFILTRSGYAGLQRYAAIWTGDNRAENDHMLLGVRLLNSLGLSGVPFSGMDVGGFTGGASPALYARWMQIGAFNPYMRNHSGINSKASEPWAYGEEVLEITRNYINLRYRLLPYLYSSFYEATQNGSPIMRSLTIDYTHDENVYNSLYENQYMFGKAFLVFPFDGVTNYGKLYFPQGKWYDLYNGRVQQGNQKTAIDLGISKLPVYVKESSIIPMQSLVQNTTQTPADTLYLHIYKGSINNKFVYYEDDGASFNYEKGEYYKRDITYNPTKKSISFSRVEGSAKSKFNNIKLILHGFKDGGLPVKINGRTMRASNDFQSLMVPISRFDPTGFSNPVEGENVQSIVFRNSSDELTLTYQD
ncbi:glycoside hydrolase family 31 protein [Mucilaginibacter sp. 44-25]|uniref:glycoside hydrolase family 31 protein n=1 Tax=Mucilaginibacter sp. 44-25 TaxID=1895794 RepID=UPI00095ACF2C|nr:glycoside hydrolase family 31 protein [Mucilaginibacter sp. 44-25]OJW14895.1 MAG: glycoside hydrolase family 31 [Mucilaginibacter sp. 44-25]